MSDIFVDPSNANRMWVTYRTTGGGRVYRSDDGGSTWTDRRPPACPSCRSTRSRWTLERQPRLGRRRPRRVPDARRGRDLGRFLERAAERPDRRPPLPSARARAAGGHTQPRRVGDPGRRLDDAAALRRAVDGKPRGERERRWFTHSWPATWHVIWTVMPTTPQPGAPQVSWKVRSSGRAPST